MSIRNYVLFTLILLAVFSSSLNAQPTTPLTYFSDYVYCSENDQTYWNEVIWFWSPDTLYGDVHSNSHIGVKHIPAFYGRVSTSEFFYYNAANPYFLVDPIEGMLEHDFDNVSMIPMQEMAILQGHHYYNIDPDNPLQYKVVGEEEGWRLDAWSETSEYDSTNLEYQEYINYNNPEEDWLAVFVEGRLQLHGIDIEGQNLIGATGEIKLMDDLLVEGAAFENEFSIDPDNENRIAIFGGEALLIADTYPNGRANMSGPGEDNSNIQISACIVLPDSGLSIEHQNDSWDDYVYCRDVNPGSNDERGEIQFFGSLIHFRRGYVHRSNCGGTGYGKHYQYDERWFGNPPPGVGETVPNFLFLNNRSFSNDNLTIEYDYVIGEGDSLVFGPGTEILFVDDYSIDFEQNSKLVINGTRDNPVRILSFDERSKPIFTNIPQSEDFVPDESFAWKNVEIYTTCDSLVVAPFLDNVLINMEDGGMKKVNLSGRGFIKEINNSVLNGNIELFCEWPEDTVSITHTKATGCLTLAQTTYIDHAVFHSNDETYDNIAFRSDREIQIKNSFIYGDYDYGFVSMYDQGFCYARYSNYYIDNQDFNHGFDWTSNVYETEPHFVNAEMGDYHLLATSPLIDAGDPETSPDPDGTRTDIGIYYFPQDSHYSNLEDFESEIPESFAVSGPYPNPFNHSTNLTVQLDKASTVDISVYDLLGRLVRKNRPEYYSTGYQKISLNLDGLSAGVYLVNVKTETESQVVKAVLMK